MENKTPEGDVTISRKRLKANSRSTEEFIRDAKLIHGKRYQYPNTVYRGSYEKVEILCMLHGPFEQMAHNHIAGHGCRECYELQKRLKGLNAFFDNARLKHGFKYDYLHVRYQNMNTKVLIWCTQCEKPFWQRPKDHAYQGYGCPKCPVRPRRRRKS